MRSCVRVQYTRARHTWHLPGWLDVVVGRHAGKVDLGTADEEGEEEYDGHTVEDEAHLEETEQAQVESLLHVSPHQHAANAGGDGCAAWSSRSTRRLISRCDLLKLRTIKFASFFKRTHLMWTASLLLE